MLIQLKSLRARMIITGGILLFLGLGILAGVSYYFANIYLTKSIDETAQAIGSDYAARVQSRIREVTVELEALASLPSIQSGSDQNAIKQAMGDALKRIGELDQITYIYLDGFSIRPNGATAQLADREYFKQVVNTKQNYVSDTLISITTKKASVILCVPVLEQGKLKGVITGTYPLDKMNDLMKDIKFKDTGYGFLLDEKGTVIAHGKNGELVGKLNLTQKAVNPELKLKHSELDDRLIALTKSSIDSGRQIRGTYTFIDGVERMMTLTPISLPGKKWTLSVTTSEAEATQEIRNLKWMMLAIAAACIVLTLVVLLQLSGMFVRPILSIRNQVVQVASGDLMVEKLDLRRQDEIGDLAKNFDLMVDSLRELVKNVQSQSHQVAAASQQLTASSEQSANAAGQVADSITQIANGSHQQLAEVGEASQVVEEMATALQQVTAAAKEVAVAAGETVAITESGQRSINQAVKQISDVGKGTAEVNSAVKDLESSSKKITEIMNLISGIAGQTNLLALNAAIEAARAGENGRGFAVVAEEVRKLAEQSNQAAQEITSLIQQNTENLNRAVQFMEKSGKDVEQGIFLVTEAGQGFNDISQAISQLSEKVQKSTVIMDEMASDSQRIVTSVQGIEAVSKHQSAAAQTVSAATQEQLASIEEIASSSNALAKLAEDLQQAINRFKM